MFYRISDTQVIIMDFKYLYHSGKSTKNLTFSTKNNLSFIILAYGKTLMEKVFFIDNKASTLIYVRENTIVSERCPYTK